MRDLYFKTPADFEKLFSKQNRKITDMMVESIGEGIEFQQKTVTLFTINIGDDEFKYEIKYISLSEQYLAISPKAKLLMIFALSYSLSLFSISSTLLLPVALMIMS